VGNKYPRYILPDNQTKFSNGYPADGAHELLTNCDVHNWSGVDSRQCEALIYPIEAAPIILSALAVIGDVFLVWRVGYAPLQLKCFPTDWFNAEASRQMGHLEPKPRSLPVSMSNSQCVVASRSMD